MSPKQHSRRKVPAAGTLGRRIFDRRQAMCLTQQQLADAMDISQSTVALWERNAVVPSLKHRKPLAGALGVYPHDLFAEIAEAEASA